MVSVSENFKTKGHLILDFSKSTCQYNVTPPALFIQNNELKGMA